MGLADFFDKLSFPSLNLGDEQAMNKLGMIKAMLDAGAAMNPGYTTLPRHTGANINAGLRAGLSTLVGWPQQVATNQFWKQYGDEMARKTAFQRDLEAMPTTKTTLTAVPGVPEDAEYVPPMETTTPMKAGELLDESLKLALKHGQFDKLSGFATAKKAFSLGGTDVEDNLIYHPVTQQPIGIRVFDPTGNSRIIKLDQGMTQAELVRALQADKRIETRNRELNLRERLGTDLGLTGDKEFIRQAMKNLPKLKDEAWAANTYLQNVKNLEDLVKNYDVTGKGGQLKAFLAPYAQMMGIPQEEWSKAQEFELFARVLSGRLRLDLIGPGPVSEVEQKLWSKLSGAGGATKEAVIRLLDYYKKENLRRIKLFNDTVARLGNLYPRAQERYGSLDTVEGGETGGVGQPPPWTSTPPKTKKSGPPPVLDVKPDANGNITGAQNAQIIKNVIKNNPKGANLSEALRNEWARLGVKSIDGKKITGVVNETVPNATVVPVNPTSQDQTGKKQPITESEARRILKSKGIVGPDQDRWILWHKKKGNVING